ncbi:MAG: hypothetical protein EXR93_02020 [Gemmatimonadetes bacterium]|nr:hypothetical protein [Gemmatimonadota bacterium]
MLTGVPVSGLAAQGRESDAGTFTVTVNGTGAWREEFIVREGRAPNRDGFTVDVRLFAGRGISPAALASIEWGPDSQPTAAEIVDAGGGRRTFVQLSKRRISVRGAVPGGESLREYPGAEPLLLADDSLVTWFAMPPRSGTSQVTVFRPRAERRETLELVDRGVDATSLGVHGATLRHVVLAPGTDETHLWFDNQGRLMKVERPAAGLLAIRTTVTP